MTYEGHELRQAVETLVTILNSHPDSVASAIATAELLARSFNETLEAAALLSCASRLRQSYPQALSCANALETAVQLAENDEFWSHTAAQPLNLSPLQELSFALALVLRHPQALEDAVNLARATTNSPAVMALVAMLLGARIGASKLPTAMLDSVSTRSDLAALATELSVFRAPSSDLHKNAELATELDNLKEHGITRTISEEGIVVKAPTRSAGAVLTLRGLAERYERPIHLEGDQAVLYLAGNAPKPQPIESPPPPNAPSTPAQPKATKDPFAARPRPATAPPKPSAPQPIELAAAARNVGPGKGTISLSCAPGIHRPV